MNGQMKRYACLILAITMLLASLALLASCGDTSGSTETEGSTNAAITAGTNVETESPRQTLDVPDVNYNGETFRVLSIDFETYYTMLDVEKITGEQVNDAIYERNRIIEDRFGIKFACEGDDYSKTYARLDTLVNAGDHEYDLIMLIDRDAFKATLNNYLLPYSEMRYVNLDKDYYFQSINEQYRIGNQTFFAYGRDCVNVLGFAVGVMYNQQLAADVGAGDLYDAVRDQTWTYEKMFEYADAAASDLDGNGVFELGEDRLGLIGHYDNVMPCFWISADEMLIEKNEEDIPTCRLDGNVRMIDIMQDVLNRVDTNAYSVLALGDVVGAFTENKALFYTHALNTLSSLRNMEAAYGVLPFPKYDAAQKDYITRSAAGWLHCVPTTCKDPEKTGIILQALAYYSSKTVYDAYYSQALTSKLLRDADSAEMVELMLSTLRVDLGDTIWYEQLRMPLVDKMVQNGNQTGLVSLFKANQRKADKEIGKVVSFLEKRGE